MYIEYTREPRPVLENAEQNAIFTYLLLDSSSPQVKQDIFFRIGLGDEYAALFQDTPFAKLYDLMPYIVKVDNNGALLKYFMDDARGEGFIILSTAALQMQRQHWASLLLATMPDSSKSFFRYYSPATLNAMLPTFTEQELRWFLGPACGILACAENGKWMRVAHKNTLLHSPQRLADTYKAVQMGWWEVRAEHFANMDKERLRALERIFCLELRRNSPEQVLWLHKIWGSLETAVNDFCQDARRDGFTNEEDMRSYVMFTAHRPVGFMQTQEVQEIMRRYDYPENQKLLSELEKLPY